jgi:hypothetical protein
VGRRFGVRVGTRALTPYGPALGQFRAQPAEATRQSPISQETLSRHGSGKALAVAGDQDRQGREPSISHRKGRLQRTDYQQKRRSVVVSGRPLCVG